MTAIVETGNIKLCYLENVDEITVLARIYTYLEADPNTTVWSVSSDYYVKLGYYLPGTYADALKFGVRRSDGSWWIVNISGGIIDKPNNKFTSIGVNAKSGVCYPKLYYILTDGTLVKQTWAWSYDFGFLPSFVYVNPKSKVSRLAIFTREVVQEEWETIVNSDWTEIPSDVYAFYTFDDYEGTVITDRSGNGRNGDLNTGRWVLRKPWR